MLQSLLPLKFLLLTFENSNSQGQRVTYVALSLTNQALQCKIIMLLVKSFYNYMEVAFMAREVKLSSETISFILTAEEVSKRYNLAYVPEIIAFGTLATMTNSPLHTYLLRKGLSHMDVVKRVNEMYAQDLQDEISYYNHMYE